MEKSNLALVRLSPSILNTDGGPSASLTGGAISLLPGVRPAARPSGRLASEGTLRMLRLDLITLNVGLSSGRSTPFLGRQKVGLDRRVSYTAGPIDRSIYAELLKHTG